MRTTSPWSGTPSPPTTKGGTVHENPRFPHRPPGKVILYRGEPCIVLEHRKDGTLLMDVEGVKR